MEIDDYTAFFIMLQRAILQPLNKTKCLYKTSHNSRKYSSYFCCVMFWPADNQPVYPNDYSQIFMISNYKPLPSSFHSQLVDYTVIMYGQTLLLNQAHAGLPACTWFLNIVSVRTYVCVCVCVSAPEAINNQWHDVVSYEPHVIG